MGFIFIIINERIKKETLFHFFKSYVLKFKEHLCFNTKYIYVLYLRIIEIVI